MAPQFCLLTSSLFQHQSQLLKYKSDVFTFQLNFLPSAFTCSLLAGDLAPSASHSSLPSASLSFTLGTDLSLCSIRLAVSSNGVPSTRNPFLYSLIFKPCSISPPKKAAPCIYTLLYNPLLSVCGTLSCTVS